MLVATIEHSLVSHAMIEYFRTRILPLKPYNDFDKTVGSISGRDTLGEAAATVNNAAQEVAAARQQLYSNLNCQ
jgi:hypothetical protein